MNVIGIQLDIVWEEKEANFRKVESMLQNAAPTPGSLVVLPEMFATGFSLDTTRTAEPFGGPTEQFLSRLAREHQVDIAAGAIAQPVAGKPRNKALVFSATGHLLAVYTKMQPFTPGQESLHHQFGQNPVIFQWEAAKVAPFVCYDLRFPEIFREAAALARPEVFIVIACWPETRIHHWTRLLQARAIENQAYVIGVNRTGNEPGHHYNGQSVIVDFHGEPLAFAGDQEGTIAATLNLDLLREYRKNLPFLDDLKRR